MIGLIHHHLLTVYFSEAPVKVVRWTANNPNARDFRYACGIRYQPLTIDIPANNKISITLNEPKTGWEATYIEATFNDAMSPRVRFILRPMKNTHRQHHLPLTPHVKRYRGVD